MKSAYEILKPSGYESYAWEDDEVVSWQSHLDYICIERLGTCGCGCVEMTAEYVRDILRLIKHADLGRRELLEFFGGDERVLYFVLYSLDDRGLLEHGSEISFSWLTDDGELMLADLERALGE